MDLPAIVIMAAAPQGSWQLESTHRKKPCFDAESGPNPFGHTRALESPFFDPKLKQGSKPWTEESHIYIYIYISISLGQHGQERSQVEGWKFKVTISIELTARS